MATDFRQQALLAAQEAAKRQRDRSQQERGVASAMPGLAQANPEGLRQHARGLHAALQSQGRVGPVTHQGPSIPHQPLVDNDAAAAGGLSSALGPENQMAPLPQMRRFGNSTVYANENPGAGYGKASYSDSPGGLNAAIKGSRLAGGGQGYAAAQGFGPFGRTEANQQAIENRVGQYTRAIDFIRSMRERDMPSERDRLQGRANQRISLNQGLGAFMNQVSDRNYAREQIKASDEQSSEQAKLANKQQQQQFENQLGLAQLMADRFRFQTVDSTDPTTMQPVQQAYLFDKMSGQAQPMTLGQQSAGAYRRNPETGEVMQQQPDGKWVLVGKMEEGS